LPRFRTNAARGVIEDLRGGDDFICSSFVEQFFQPETRTITFETLADALQSLLGMEASDR
jgi:hypothetical protein